jgi:glyoxylase-like metal-dependent hydrolase (beta-lactamase superfamily II)
MIVDCVVSGPVQANNYLIVDEVSKEAALIDCSAKSPQILQKIEEYGAKLKYILLTHGHFDHVLGVSRMKSKYGAKVLIHESDVPFLEHINESIKFFMPSVGGVEVPEYDGVVKDGDELFLGNHDLQDNLLTTIKVIHTPGHTPGGVCYLAEDKLFSGDTLFLESIGRTDLPGGDFKTLQNSIVEKLFTLNDETIVYPGHDVKTTIRHEKRYNGEVGHG